MRTPQETQSFYRWPAHTLLHHLPQPSTKLGEQGVIALRGIRYSFKFPGNNGRRALGHSANLSPGGRRYSGTLRLQMPPVKQHVSIFLPSRCCIYISPESAVAPHISTDSLTPRSFPITSLSCLPRTPSKMPALKRSVKSSYAG